MLPEVDDEVLVLFAHNDLGQPYVLGGLFNGIDKPPEGETLVGSSGKVEFRRLVSPAGRSLTLGDGTDGAGIAIRTGGQQQEEVELDAAAHKIRITSSGDVEIEGKGTGKVTITAGTTLVDRGEIIAHPQGAADHARRHDAGGGEVRRSARAAGHADDAQGQRGGNGRRRGAAHRSKAPS